MKAVSKIPKEKNCLLTLKFRPLKSYVEEEHSADKDFQSLVVQGKELLKEKPL